MPPLLFLPVLCRTDVHDLAELLVEVVYVFVAHAGGNLVDFHVGLIQQLGGFADPQLIQIGVEADAGALSEQLAQIGTVVAEQRSDGL